MGKSVSTQIVFNYMASSPNENENTSRLRADQLLQLVRETCAHPKGSPQRQRGLTRLVRSLSQQLWHTYDAYYPDALQQTWIYFCRNLCEATTGQAYDPDIASLVTWLNAYLKRRLQDFQIAENKSRATTVSSSSLTSYEEAPLDPIDCLPAPPDVPPLLEQVRDWVESNVALDKIYVSNHPEVTAKVLILKRLPPETPWKQLSAEYGISIGTLSSFYQRQCLSTLRNYGQSQGYF